jgi:hypothetical protein
MAHHDMVRCLSLAVLFFAPVAVAEPIFISILLSNNCNEWLC